MYFNLVAIPPLICLSALFSSKTILTFFAKLGFIFISLSDTSLCTVVAIRNGRINIVKVSNNSRGATNFI